jgi:hypothetical protein
MMWRAFARRVQYWRGSLIEEWGVGRSLLVVGAGALSLIGAQAVGASTAAAAIVAVAIVVLTLILFVHSEGER